MRRLRVVDSHTEGEPTRVVVSGGPDLRGLTPTEARDRLRDDADWLRKASILEPRGHDAIVGAVLLESTQPDTDLGVVYFNNAGYLGMCGHGTIGLARTLAYLGRAKSGDLLLETPVGLVRAHLHPDLATVTIDNVPSFRLTHNVTVDVPGYGPITGDVAYGGNWFFLASAGDRALTFEHIGSLTAWTSAIREALADHGITGDNRALIDHIEVFGPPHDPQNHSRNFVLCPGSAYDRSPCGTGTSAKLACLAADGKLDPGEVWLQESVIGTTFEGRYRLGEEGKVIPSITGRAFVTADSELLLEDQDPLRFGIE